MLGYRLRDGKLEIVPEEAELVQYIFLSYLSGASMLSIAKELNAHGIPTLNSGRWNRTSVRCVLINEKYTGDMILQKTYRKKDASCNAAYIRHTSRQRGSKTGTAPTDTRS